MQNPQNLIKQQRFENKTRTKRIRKNIQDQTENKDATVTWAQCKWSRVEVTVDGRRVFVHLVCFPLDYEATAGDGSVGLEYDSEKQSRLAASKVMNATVGNTVGNTMGDTSAA